MLLKLRLAILAMAAAFLFSACSTGFEPNATDLMRPPRLTAEQKAIDDALRAAVDGDPVLKYPKSGDYRSAFVFHNIDGDGDEEALVFYATEANDHARMVVLDQVDGVWNFPPRDLPGGDQDVEFVAFANITSTETQDIVIGWSNPADTEMTLGVYSYQDGLLVKMLPDSADTSYHDYLIDDLDRNGLADIFLLSRNSASSEKSAWIKLVSFDGYSVEKVSELQLSDGVTKFAGTVAGKLSPKSEQRGIFVDEVLTGDTLVTEVFTIENQTFTAVIEQDMIAQKSTPVSEEETPSTLYEATLYEQTRRADINTVCADINQDGIIEIPTGRLMPGYDDSDSNEGDRIYLTEYNQLKADRLERVFAAAINQSGGYRVEYPPEWIDKVTVVEQSENGEWLFFEYKDSLDDVSEELARIRVVAQKDYRDKSLDSYQVLRTRGTFTYYGFITDSVAGNPLAITPQQLANLFALL